MTDRPDRDPPSRSGDSGAEPSNPARADLLDIVTGELRKLWIEAQRAGADPEELRRLLKERRETIEHRSDNSDG